METYIFPKNVKKEIKTNEQSEVIAAVKADIKNVTNGGDKDEKTD